MGSGGLGVLGDSPNRFCGLLPRTCEAISCLCLVDGGFLLTRSGG